MDSFWAAAYPAAGDATIPKPDSHAVAHAGTDLSAHAGGEPERHADTTPTLTPHRFPRQSDGYAQGRQRPRQRRRYHQRRPQRRRRAPPPVAHANGGTPTHADAAALVDLTLYLHNNPAAKNTTSACPYGLDLPGAPLSTTTTPIAAPPRAANRERGSGPTKATLRSTRLGAPGFAGRSD
jgi:hypothetical protein